MATGRWMNAAPLRRCCSREGVERPRTLGTVRATGANDLAAGEVKRWERAAHREEISYYETHCISRTGDGLDFSRLRCQCQRSAGIGGGARPYPAKPHEDQVKSRREGTHGDVDRQPTSRDFIALLPLTLTMDDLFRREKYGPLPRALSKGEPKHSYEIGDIGYWSPGPDVAIYYRNDGEQIPDPGIILIGKIDSGVEAFNVPGSVKVTVEAASK